MKCYTMPFGASLEHRPEHPERTAKKSGSGLNFDVTFQVWPNRQAMARSIRMQQSRMPHHSDWKPCIALSDGEGH